MTTEQVHQDHVEVRPSIIRHSSRKGIKSKSTIKSKSKSAAGPKRANLTLVLLGDWVKICPGVELRTGGFKPARPVRRPVKNGDGLKPYQSLNLVHEHTRDARLCLYPLYRPGPGDRIATAVPHPRSNIE
ncbi:hypothetical protein DFH09DRAFT_1076049 [Mycena vulgaris]|nr:hypothetical protein DFH09DRAFT_1076049 [Mycena vulgaris]